MRIAVTGPHCCGKSTVLKKVKEKLLLLPEVEGKINFITFSGAEAPIDYSSSAKLKEDKDKELLLTYWMIARLMEREIATIGDNVVNVFDRCLVDQYIYPKKILGEYYPLEMKRYIESYLVKYPYDYIFVLPKNLELLEKYGQKDRTVEYVTEIEDGYFQFAKENPNCVILESEQEKQVDAIFLWLYQKVMEK